MLLGRVSFPVGYFSPWDRRWPIIRVTFSGFFFQWLQHDTQYTFWRKGAKRYGWMDGWMEGEREKMFQRYASSITANNSACRQMYRGVASTVHESLSLSLSLMTVWDVYIFTVNVSYILFRIFLWLCCCWWAMKSRRCRACYFTSVL